MVLVVFLDVGFVFWGTFSTFGVGVGGVSFLNFDMNRHDLGDRCPGCPTSVIQGTGVP